MGLYSSLCCVASGAIAELSSLCGEKKEEGCHRTEIWLVEVVICV